MRGMANITASPSLLLGTRINATGSGGGSSSSNSCSCSSGGGGGGGNNSNGRGKPQEKPDPLLDGTRKNVLLGDTGYRWPRLSWQPDCWNVLCYIGIKALL